MIKLHLLNSEFFFSLQPNTTAVTVIIFEQTSHVTFVQKKCENQYERHPYRLYCLSQSSISINIPWSKKNNQIRLPLEIIALRFSIHCFSIMKLVVYSTFFLVVIRSMASEKLCGKPFENINCYCDEISALEINDRQRLTPTSATVITFDSAEPVKVIVNNNVSQPETEMQSYFAISNRSRFFLAVVTIGEPKVNFRFHDAYQEFCIGRMNNSKSIRIGRWKKHFCLAECFINCNMKQRRDNENESLLHRMTLATARLVRFSSPTSLRNLSNLNYYPCSVPALLWYILFFIFTVLIIVATACIVWARRYFIEKRKSSTRDKLKNNNANAVNHVDRKKKNVKTISSFAQNNLRQNEVYEYYINSNVN